MGGRFVASVVEDHRARTPWLGRCRRVPCWVLDTVVLKALVERMDAHPADFRFDLIEGIVDHRGCDRGPLVERPAEVRRYVELAA